MRMRKTGRGREAGSCVFCPIDEAVKVFILQSSMTEEQLDVIKFLTMDGVNRQYLSPDGGYINGMRVRQVSEK